MEGLSKIISRNLSKSRKDFSFDRDIIGNSAEIKRIKTLISRLKGSNSHVLLYGESGTGKELFARLINAQEEGERPFVSVNCAAIPHNLAESILFGHEKGSFTGALEKSAGKFELADGGDIFLDEISTLSDEVQAKLLRVIQEKEIETIGSNRPSKINFRVISATNEKLDELIAKGKFREDLFYRLNTIEIEIPPLRERGKDITEIANHFLKFFSTGSKIKTFSKEVEKIFLDHEWKGNVRELKNTVEKLCILPEDDEINLEDLKLFNKSLFSNYEKNKDSLIKGYFFKKEDAVVSSRFKQALRIYERDYLIKAFEKHRWNKSKTSRYLGITRNMLYRKVEDLNIDSGLNF